MRPIVATETLRQEISSGRFRPGQKLNETDLAASLGISRNTLRESFATLTSQGILTRIPNRGVFICAPTKDHARDLYLARAQLEPAAVLWGEFLDIDSLDAVVMRAERARNSGDFHVCADHNQIFHQQVVEATGSEITADFMRRVMAVMRLAFLQIAEQVPEFHREFVSQNREIVTILREGDRSRAAEVLRADLLATRELVTGYLPGEQHYG